MRPRRRGAGGTALRRARLQPWCHGSAAGASKEELAGMVRCPAGGLAELSSRRRGRRRASLIHSRSIALPPVVPFVGGRHPASSPTKAGISSSTWCSTPTRGQASVVRGRAVLRDYPSCRHATAGVRDLVGRFSVQHATSEWILTSHPDLRHKRAPFLKGWLAWNVLASAAYATAAFGSSVRPSAIQGGWRSRSVSPNPGWAR